jgi:hypothetical protein
MNTFWEYAKQLEGTTLYTSKRKSPFRVIHVGEKKLIIQYDTGGTTMYSRKVIEAACQELLNGGEVTGKNMSDAGVASSKSNHPYPPVIAEAILQYERNAK